MSEREAIINENWRPIWGWWRHYEVSDLGRVRRIARGRAAIVGHVLGAFPDGSGYLQLKLCRGKHMIKTCKVHFLVADTFIGPRPELKQINHKNGNRQDNRLENLEYVTVSENVLHSWRVIGRRPRPTGEANGRAILSNENVAHIRARYAAGGVTQKVLGKEFGVSESAVQYIVKGKHWA